MISRRQLIFVASNALALQKVAFARIGAEPLRIGLEDLEPWNIVENGQQVGILTNLVDELAFRTKIAFSPRFAPSSRLSLELENKRLDLAVLFRRPTSGTMEFVGDCFRQPVMVATLAGMPISTPQDLSGKVLATSRGMQFDHYADEFGFRLFSTANISSALNMLLHRRVDGVLASEAAISWSLRQLNVRRDRLEQFRSIGTNQVAIWARTDLSDETPNIRADLSSALENMRHEGRMQNLMQSWRY